MSTAGSNSHAISSTLPGVTTTFSMSPGQLGPCNYYKNAGMKKWSKATKMLDDELYDGFLKVCLISYSYASCPEKPEIQAGLG